MLAYGVVLEVDYKKIEDGCWLRKEKDPMHINIAELEAILKGVNMALQWGFKSMIICTDSASVFSWLKSIIDKDRPVRVSGLSSILVKRRLELLKSLFEELDVKVTARHITTSKNHSDALTRVPQKWLSQNVAAVSMSSSNHVDLIKAIHSNYHQGVKKTLYFCRRRHPELEISSQMVQNVIRSCERCRAIDPQPVRMEDGVLEVDENWSRIALDVTYFDNRKYLTLIDCGPSRFSVWKPIASESASELTKAVETAFREHGPPSEVLLDNFSIFKSEMFSDMLDRWSVRRWFRCAYRPQGNGIIERHHRTIKRMASRSNSSALDMVFGYNLSPRKNGVTPANQIFKNYWWWHLDKNVERPIANLSSFFNIGDAVLVKPNSSRCTTEWQKGKVTKVNSRWNVEVNGVPRHVRDIRHSRLPSVEVQQTAPVTERPVREVRKPAYLRDYVLY